MSARKSILKVLIIIILAVFLLSTGLMSIMYLSGPKSAQTTGDIVTGTTSVVELTGMAK